MKVKILILSILFCGFSSIVFSQDGWFWQNPLQTGNVYRDTYFIDENSGWIVGEWGVIIHITNGGENYSIDYIGEDNNLNGIFFIDENNGWIVGNMGKIFKTTNGGVSWNEQISGTENDLNRAFFLNENTGWIVGWNGTLLATTDGGTNWIINDIGTGEVLYNTG